MKSSLGTLAAVVALAAASHTASADVQYATHLFGDIIDPSNSYIDINNDNIVDFAVLNGNRLFGIHYIDTGLQNSVATDGNNQSVDFNFGDTVNTSHIYQSFGYIDLSGPSIVGLSFWLNDNIHFAWLQFIIDGSDLIIQDGAWQTIANSGIEIAAVPEPSTVAAGIALLAGAVTLLRRRSKRHAA